MTNNNFKTFTLFNNFNLKLTDCRLYGCSSNENFYRSDRDPGVIVHLADTRSDRVYKLDLPVVRNAATGQFKAIMPMNADKERSALVWELYRTHAAPQNCRIDLSCFADVLTREVNKRIENERTDDDRARELVNSIARDMEFFKESFEADASDLDGVPFDPEDEFHLWLVDRRLAAVKSDDDEDGYLDLAADFNDRVGESFAEYFLAVDIAFNRDHTRPCVNAVVSYGGPSVSIEQFFGSNYEVNATVGTHTATSYLDSEDSEWLDSMFGVNC